MKLEIWRGNRCDAVHPLLSCNAAQLGRLGKCSKGNDATEATAAALAAAGSYDARHQNRSGDGVRMPLRGSFLEGYTLIETVNHHRVEFILDHSDAKSTQSSCHLATGNPFFFLGENGLSASSSELRRCS